MRESLFENSNSSSFGGSRRAALVSVREMERILCTAGERGG